MEQVKEASAVAAEKAGDFVDEKTGGQYADKVDMAQEKVKEIADDLDQAN